METQQPPNIVTPFLIGNKRGGDPLRRIQENGPKRTVLTEGTQNGVKGDTSRLLAIIFTKDARTLIQNGIPNGGPRSTSATKRLGGTGEKK